VLKKTKHWFLPLNNFEPFLKKWFLKDNKDNWKANVFGQVKSWINEGLKPRAITRDLDWGIPVPLDEAKNKVLYVWFDAPIGYISATKEWAMSNNKDWEPYWKDSKTQLVHFLGKDNIVFHCIIFPSMLKATDKYILPANVPANEFLNLEGKKISTSKNWAIWLHEYLEDFPNMQDTLRYTLTSNAPENKDNDFTWKDFQAKNNNELVAIFGNFINRVVVLTHKYYDGTNPDINLSNDIDKETVQEIYKFPKKIGDLIERYKFREAVNTVIDLARLGNKYLAEEEPWKLIKTDQKDRVKTIMNISLQLCGVLSIVCEPFLPSTSKKLKKILNFENSSWNSISIGNPIKINNINKGELIFRKIEDDEIELQVQKLNESA
jgi:methionyl-tRNA synthetase